MNTRRYSDLDVRNCMMCGRIFNYVNGQPICAHCKKDLEDKFKDVKQFIRRNPEASIGEVADTCEVEVKQIRQWVREERLTFSKDSAIGIECEKCGKTIRTGRFCDSCKEDTMNELSGVLKKQNSDPVVEKKEVSKDTANKMRYFNRDR